MGNCDGHYLEIANFSFPPSILCADYSAYQQQQQPYAGYNYGTQAAQPQTSAVQAASTYQTGYPSASTSYAVTVSTTTPSAGYSQTTATTYATTYAGYTTGTSVATANYAAGTNASYSSPAKPEAYGGYQDPNATARSATDGGQTAYAAQPPPPPQPPSVAPPQPPLGQVCY